jgi:hypothetical protein
MGFAAAGVMVTLWRLPKRLNHPKRVKTPISRSCTVALDGWSGKEVRGAQALSRADHLPRRRLRHWFAPMSGGDPAKRANLAAAQRLAATGLIEPGRARCDGHIDARSPSDEGER